MALCGEMNDDIAIFDKTIHDSRISDIAFNEPVIIVILDIFKIPEIAAIGKIIEVSYPVVGIIP
jgi:hypothetical protein